MESLSVVVGVMREYPVVNGHHHIGNESSEKDRTFEWSENVGQIIRAMDENQVDASMLMPLGGKNDHSVADVHDQIYEATQEYPGRIFGVAAPNPHLRTEFVHDEIERCVQELDFTDGCIPTWTRSWRKD